MASLLLPPTQGVGFKTLTRSSPSSFYPNCFNRVVRICTCMYIYIYIFMNTLVVLLALWVQDPIGNVRVCISTWG